MSDDDDEDSHTEYDPRVFHPSQVGYSPWLLLVKKLGLTDTSDLDGIFQIGSLIHEFVQTQVLRDQTDMDWYGPARQGNFEVAVEHDESGLRFVGHADVVDRDAGVVYDIKSRNGWYNFDPPVDRHLDQLHCYMRGLDMEYGQVIYLSKSDLELRTWPEDGAFTFDGERWADIVERCTRVRDSIYSEGIPQSESEIPFEKPDTYFADNTSLDFSSVNGGGDTNE